VRDSQRERIVDATAAIVAERGLGALTVPDIARRAGVSHQTFYAIYRSKQDAYLGAQKVGLHQALQIAGRAWQARMPDWPNAVAAGLRALIDYLVSEPQHAHLTIVDTFGASPQTIEIREHTLQSFAAFFDRRHRVGPELDAPDPLAEAPARIAVEAVLGGCWQVLHHYVESGRLEELPAAVPQITYLLLTPFVGSDAATRIAHETPAAART
jgi:AcrR family transcriptional regulator